MWVFVRCVCLNFSLFPGPFITHGSILSFRFNVADLLIQLIFQKNLLDSTETRKYHIKFD